MALAFLLCIGSAVSSLVAQETLTGRVSNAGTGRNLQGARVEIQGTNQVAYTDFEGVYRFSQVPPGSVNLAVSYTGLTPQVVPVVVGTGSPNRRDVELTSDVYTLSKFVVAGEREGNALAITAQRQSTGVKSIVSSDALGSLGANPADLVARLPGVFGENDGSGIRYIQIRGMANTLNTVTMDGNRMADAASAGSTREFQFTQVNADTVGRIEVVKSPTPDMDADSIGGAVNFVSKSAFDQKGRRIYGSYGLIYRYNDGIDVPRQAYTFSYSEVFGGKLGVSFNWGNRKHLSPIPATSHNYQANKLDDPAYTYQFGTEDYHLKQSRFGGGVKLDYKISDNSRVYLNIQRNRMDEKSFNHYATYAAAQSIATRDAAGNLTGTGAILPEFTTQVTEWRPLATSTVTATSVSTWKHVTAMHGEIGAAHKFNTWDIDYNGYKSKSTTAYPHQETAANVATGIGIRVTATDQPYFPTITQTAGPDILNPDSYASNIYTVNNNQGVDALQGAQINVKKRFESVAPAWIKAGLRVRRQNRDLFANTDRWTYLGPDGVAGLNAATGKNDDNMAQFVNPNVKRWGGLEKYPKLPWLRYPNDDLGVKPYDNSIGLDLAEAVRNNPGYFVEDVAQKTMTGLYNRQNFTETVKAAYIMGNVEIGKLSITGGLRLEETKTEGTGGKNEITPAEAALRAAYVGPVTLAELIRRNTAQYSGRQTAIGKYRQVFPGLHLKYEPINGLIARASYSTNIGRPAIGQLIPNTTVNNDARTIVTSNPSLKPQLANNFDVGVEYYFEPVGMFSAGVFLKEIKQYIFTLGGNVVQSGADNGYNGDYVGYTYSTQFNAGWGKVKGFELAYQQQFTFLPGFWKSFGVYANYGKNETKGNYGAAIATTQVAGFIPETANAGISYIRSPFSLRFQFAHSSTRLITVSTDASRLLYERARDTLDVKSTYAINNNFILYLDANNLFGEQERAREFTGHRRGLGYDTGPQFLGGLNVRF